MSRVVIRKYENRRLYDTSASRYVNLDDIARIVREGADVEVLDARSGEDLTRVVLTQIIMEDAKGSDSGLPLELLRKLVMASDRVTHEFLTRYLSTVTEMYQKAQSALHASPLDVVRNLFTSQTSAPPVVYPEEVEALRRRVEELEGRLKKLSAKKKKEKKSPGHAA